MIVDYALRKTATDLTREPSGANAPGSILRGDNGVVAALVTQARNSANNLIRRLRVATPVTTSGPAHRNRRRRAKER